MASLLDLKDVTVDYTIGKNRISALDNVSLEIPNTGYTLGLVGESGSGKTTLGLSIMNVIDPPGKIRSGRIDYQGIDVLKMRKDKLRKYRWSEVSMIYQSAMNSLNPVKTIINPIVEVLMEHKHASKKEAKERAISLLNDLGIDSEIIDNYPHELSGGMRQRVVIALALALSPKMLIADEPTSALDVVTQRQILAVMKREVIQRKLSLLFITHEISLLKGLVDNVAVMFKGEIVERGSLAKVLNEPLHPYTQMLLGTLLTLNSELSSITEFSRKSVIDVGANDVSKIGCKYTNYCKFAFDRCRREVPELSEIESGRLVACHKYN